MASEPSCPEGLERCLEGLWRRPAPAAAPPQPTLVLEPSPRARSEKRHSVPPPIVVSTLSSPPMVAKREMRPEQAVAAAAAEAAATRAAAAAEVVATGAKVAVPGAAAAVEAAAEAAEAQWASRAKPRPELEVVTLSTNEEHYKRQNSENEALATDAATGQTLSPMSMTTRSATDSNLQLGAEACMPDKDVRWFSAELERQRCDYAARLQKMVSVLAEEGQIWEARMERVAQDMGELRQQHAAQLSDLHAHIQRLSGENAELRRMTTARELDSEVRRLNSENKRLRRLSCPEIRRLSSESASVQDLSSILEPDSEAPVDAQYLSRQSTHPEIQSMVDLSTTEALCSSSPREVRRLSSQSTQPEHPTPLELEAELPRMQSARITGLGSIRELSAEVIRRSSVQSQVLGEVARLPQAPAPATARRHPASPERGCGAATACLLLSPDRRLCRVLSPDAARPPRRRTLSPEQTVRRMVSPVKPLKPLSPVRPLQAQVSAQLQPQKAVNAALQQASSSKAIGNIPRPLISVSPRMLQRGSSIPLVVSGLPASATKAGASPGAPPPPVPAPALQPRGAAGGVCRVPALAPRQRSLF